MTEPQIYEALTTIFHEAFGDHTIVLAPSTTADHVPGWDSVKMVMIIIAVEQRFRIRLRSKEIDKLKTVGDLAALIHTKVPA